MKLLRVLLLAVIAAGVIGLVACTDAVSTDDEVNPLTDDADKVYGHVYEGGTHTPVESPVIVYKRAPEEDDWIDIDQQSSNEDGFYEFHLDPWPAGWGGMVDCTADDETAHNDFYPYPQQGPVEADIYLE